MINALRKRFIFINMLFVTSLLVLIIVTMNIITYQTGYHELKEDVSYAALRDAQRESTHPEFAMGEDYEEVINPLPNSYTFSVTILPNDKYDIRGTSINSADAIKVTNAAVIDGKEDGLLKSYSVFYLKTVNPFGVETFTFASSRNFNAHVRSSIFTSIVIFVCAFISFFIISYYLSKLTVKPVEDAWNKQKKFIADASHDLKTPLTVILANSDIISKHQEDLVANQIEWINSTKDEALMMKELVDLMLESAKTENMKENLEFEDVCLSEITTKVVLQMEPVAFDKEIEIESNIEPGLTHLTNSNAFYRIVQSLLDNAIKYSPRKEKILVNLESIKQGKQQGFILSVNNKGDVISEEDLSHMFERFYRVDTSRNSDGYGLGLSIVKALVERLNGKINVTSNLENGTTFTVHLIVKGK